MSKPVLRPAKTKEELAEEAADADTSGTSHGSNHTEVDDDAAQERDNDCPVEAPEVLRVAPLPSISKSLAKYNGMDWSLKPEEPDSGDDEGVKAMASSAAKGAKFIDFASREEDRKMGGKLGLFVARVLC